MSENKENKNEIRRTNENLILRLSKLSSLQLTTALSHIGGIATRNIRLNKSKLEAATIVKNVVYMVKRSDGKAATVATPKPQYCTSKS